MVATGIGAPGHDHELDAFSPAGLAERAEAARAVLRQVEATELVDEVDRSIRKVVELGFLRPLPGPTVAYEVRRILKAFVDAQWLGELDARLAEYAELAAGTGTGTDDGGAS